MNSQDNFTLLNINYHIKKLYKYLNKHSKICHKADVVNIYRGIFHGPSQNYSPANLPFRRIFFSKKMQAHHYLGALPKIGNTIWYIATYKNNWQALLIFSAAALKCRVRDQWIGWDFRHQYDRLNLIANNSRFLILPGRHKKNLASKVLSLCRQRIQQDWVVRFGYPLLIRHDLMEQSIRLQIGLLQDIPRAINESVMDTATL